MSTKLASAPLIARVQDVVLSPADSSGFLSKINFSLEATSFLFLVGPAGSGKSTILDLIGLQGLPTRGRVEILGVDSALLPLLDRPRIRRRLGVMFQDQRLLPDLDVFANVALAARVARRRVRDYGPEVSQLLAWVGLGGRGAEPISRLTEGEKRRLCLARAMVNRPELLIVDEPTGGLGHKAERAIMRLIVEINKAGTPVIFSTRDLSLAVDSGARVYDMPAGIAS